MSMQIEYQPGECQEVACDLLACPIFEGEAADLTALKFLPKATRDSIQSALSRGEFKPEPHQTWRIGRPAGLKARNLLLIGAGNKSKFNPAKLRDIAGTAVRAAKSCRAKTMAFFCRGEDKAGPAARLAAEGALYANYESDIYKTLDKEDRDVERIYILLQGKAGRSEIRDSIRKGEIVGEATNLARTLGNEPANVLTPAQFAERAAALGAKVGLEAQVFERDEMEKMGMNTLLAVSRGSEEPPKLIVLRIKSQAKRRARSPLFAIVGKGVTFDSGGISLKPSEKMEEMKSDMAGGAAVLGAMIALAQLNPRNTVIGLIPAVENLPSGKATKPGDVVKSYLGKTVEIINTDAEGRLILADAMAYARTMGATHVIDIATLTGACIVALGYVNAGMLGTDQKMMDRLRKNCSLTGEKLWQLPLDDEYRLAIRSEIADIKNVGNRAAGVITAAKFLQEFVEDTPWVHLDIAGMDLERDGRPFACKGATGFGVRTLVYFLE
jgi:leucyl aminopeptidase